MDAGRVPQIFAQFLGIAEGSRAAAGQVARAAAEATPTAQRSGLLAVATKLEGLTAQAGVGIRELEAAAMGGAGDDLVRHAFGAAAVARQGVNGLDGVTTLLRDAAGSGPVEAVAASVSDDAMRRLEMISQTFGFVAMG